MKKLCTALLASILALTMAACGTQENPSTPESTAPETAPESAAEPESTPEAAPETSGRTQLIMATEAGFRPYEYYEGNEIVGVDVDIAKEIAAELGVELVVEHMEFGSIIPSVDSGKADFGAAGMSITEERRQQVDFTIEYATSKQVILTKADSPIQGEADLAGKSIGVQLGTVADLALSEEADYPGVTVERYNKYMEATNDLIAGRIDAIVLDVLPAQELLTMDESLVIREQELFTDVYAFCVKKGNTELLEAMNRVMERLVAEGKIEEFTATHTAG